MYMYGDSDLYSDSDSVYHSRRFSSEASDGKSFSYSPRYIGDSYDDSNHSHDREMLKLIRKINDQQSTEPFGDLDLKTSKNSRYYITVKVDTDVFVSNRIQLALKSDYFEKLLTADFNEKDSECVEIHTVDSCTFSTILEMVSKNKKLETVLNLDNYAALLWAMDYLQMEIDLKIFRRCMYEYLQVPTPLFPNVWKLLSYIAENPNFQYLLPTFYQYFSIHLSEIADCEEILLLPVTQLVAIITRNIIQMIEREKHSISQLCARWITHDMVNRLSSIFALVNAVKYRYGFSYKMKGENLNMQHLYDTDEKLKLKAVLKYFNILLDYNGEIVYTKEESNEKEEPRNRFSDRPEYEENRRLKRKRRSISQSEESSSSREPSMDRSETTPQISMINKIDEKSKWTAFLQSGHFYDITVKVEGKSYKLHLYKLKSVSRYFARLSSQIFDRDAEHLLDEIDQTTFDMMIDYIYFNSSIRLRSKNIFRILKACTVLEINDLISRCESFIERKKRKLSGCFMELLDFCCGKSRLNYIYATLCDHLIYIWPEASDMPLLGSISYDTLENILNLSELEIDREKEILDFCSKWIAHDVNNRFKLLPRIASAINHNYMTIYDCDKMEMATDSTMDYSESFIKFKLKEILVSTSLVSSGTTPKKNWKFNDNQLFISMEKKNLNEIVILDAAMNKVTSISSMETPHDRRRDYFKFNPSATIVKDDIFILRCIGDEAYFNVYNRLSKKCFSLATSYRMHRSNMKGTLLNCNNQVYFCFNNGCIIQYSFELNRWMRVARSDNDIKIMTHVSDGKALYRVREGILFPNCVIEEYNFKRGRWTALPNSPSGLDLAVNRRLLKQVTVSGALAIVSSGTIFLFDRRTRKWCEIPIFSLTAADSMKTVFIQFEDNSPIVYVTTSQGIYRGSLTDWCVFERVAGVSEHHFFEPIHAIPS